jgi:hypothetical protein
MGEPNQNLEQCLGLNEMVEKRDVTSHAVTVLKLLRLNRNKNMTMPQLIKEWRQNPKEAPQWYVTFFRSLYSSDTIHATVTHLIYPFIHAWQRSRQSTGKRHFGR